MSSRRPTEPALSRVLCHSGLVKHSQWAHARHPASPCSSLWEHKASFLFGFHVTKDDGLLSDSDVWIFELSESRRSLLQFESLRGSGSKQTWFKPISTNNSSMTLNEWYNSFLYIGLCNEINWMKHTFPELLNKCAVVIFIVLLFPFLILQPGLGL